MVKNVLYFKIFEEVNNSFLLELARREICWLIKDRLYKKGARQKGWSFIRGQVEKISDSSIFDRDIEGLYLEDKGDIEQIESFKKSKGATFRVPLNAPIELEHLTSRLVYTDKILEIHEIRRKASIYLYKCDRTFWSKELMENWNSRGDLVECATFNIINPYQGKLVLNFDKNKIIDLDISEIGDIDESVFSEILPFTSMRYTIPHEELNDDTLLLDEKLKRISKILLLGSARGKLAMDMLGLRTGALTGAIALFKIKDPKPGQDSKLVGLANKYDLSIHLYLRNPITGDLYIGFRKHPIAADAKKLEGKFNANFEIRKFLLVEEIWNNLPGHKGPDGERRTVRHITSTGVEIALKRPGYKDCEEYIIDFEPPNLPDICSEAKKYLYDPETGEAFANAIWDIWEAKRNIEDIVADYSSILSRVHARTLTYDTEAFLYYIHYIFINEDINYRFWYHPPGRGQLYRKQGRNQLMNCLLLVLSGNDHCIETKRTDTLIPRPEGFNGPKHLKEWFERHLRSEGSLERFI